MQEALEQIHAQQYTKSRSSPYNETNPDLNLINENKILLTPMIEAFYKGFSSKFAKNTCESY